MRYFFFASVLMICICLSGCIKNSRKFILEVQDGYLWYLNVEDEGQGCTLNRGQLKVDEIEKFSIINSEKVITEKDSIIYPLLLDGNRYLYLRMKTSDVELDKKGNRNIDCELVSMKADGKTEILTVLSLYNNYILKSRKSSSLILADSEKIIFPYICIDGGTHKLNILVIHRTDTYKILKNEVIDSFDADLFTPFFSWNDQKNIIFYSRPEGRNVQLAGYDLRLKKVISYQGTEGITCPVFYENDLYGLKNSATSGSIIRLKGLKEIQELVKTDKKVFPPFHVGAGYIAFVSSADNSRLSWLTETITLNIVENAGEKYTEKKSLGIKNSGVVFKQKSLFGISGQGIQFQYIPEKDAIVYYPQRFEELTTLSDIFEIENDYKTVLKTLQNANKMLFDHPELDQNGDFRIENMKDIARIYEVMNNLKDAELYYSKIVDFYFSNSTKNFSLRKKYGEEVYYLLLKQLECRKNELKGKFNLKFYSEYIEILLRGIEFRRGEFVFLTSLSAGRLLNENFNLLEKVDISISGEFLRSLLASSERMKFGLVVTTLLEYTLENAPLFDRLDEAYWLLGNLYQKQGNAELSEKTLKVLKDKFPGSPYLIIEED